MAGDWIKMRGSLNTHPKVIQIAKMIARDADVCRRLSTGHNGRLEDVVTRDVTRDVTIASLLRIWCACNEHTSDGVWHGVEIDDLDQIAGVPGFGAAMKAVGWAVPSQEDGTITFPNFLEYNAPAKNGGRSSASERQRRYRERKKLETSEVRDRDASCDGKGDVTRDVTGDVTGVTREEKRRGKKNTPPVSHQSGSASPSANQSSGSRLPGDWVLPDDWLAWAISESDWPAERIRAIAERFRDHWIAQPGAKGRKSDWQATWRNWVRRDLETNHGNRRPQSSAGGHRDQVRAAVSDLEDRSWAEGL